jgi:D-sedoheptulose 7-phosphate isomerase
MNNVISKRFAEHADILRRTEKHLGDKIASAAGLMIDCYHNGGGVFLFGNGGSAADAQHVAGELVGRFLLERRALKAEALSTNTSILTCLGNDYSFECIFTRQLEANARPGDLAVGFTTSGNSANVVAGLKYAREHFLKTIAFTGEGGGQCAEYADVLIDIPSKVTARVQEAGQVVYHILCELVEAELAHSKS